MAPRLHAEGLCETTAALQVRTLEHDRVDRRVQGPVIPASTPGACVRRLSESHSKFALMAPKMWPVFPLGNAAGMTLA